MDRRVVPYEPREQFQPFHNRHQRWACIVAHRRCGKTVACLNDEVKRAFTDRKENGRYGYIAPYYSQAKTIAWEYLLRYTEPVRTHANASELWVQLVNGSRVRLFGADNPDAMRGQYLDGVVLDEYADMKPRVWGEIVRPLLADRKGWATFIGTPRGHNAFYDIYKAAAGPEWFRQRLLASETGLIDAGELADAKRSMSDDQYEQEFECSFEAAILGAYYGVEMRQAEESGRVCDVELDPMFPVHTAWDIGYTDDTAIWFYQVVAGEVRVLDYYGESGKDIPHYVGVVKGKGYDYGMHYLPHDARAKTLASGGRSVIEQLAAHLGVARMKFAPELSVQDGIQAVRLMLPRAWFDLKCNEGTEALKQYQREWDEDKKCFRVNPKHDWTSHAADAMRMLALAWKAEKFPEQPQGPRFAVQSGRTDTLDNLWASRPRSEGRF